MSMGSYLSDLHTHTDFSHGKGSPEDIVRAGIRGYSLLPQRPQ